uniref:Pentatricopeptide repeat-containing protein n=1 Tax=Solanum tuberosum TaxID=4113 RepID=M1CB08_SOLTU
MSVNWRRPYGPTFEWYYPSKGMPHKILKGNSKKGSKDAKPIIRTGTCKKKFNTFHPPQIGKDDDDNNEDVVDSTAFMLCCRTRIRYSKNALLLEDLTQTCLYF